MSGDRLLGARRGRGRGRSAVPQGGVVLLDATRVGTMRQAVAKRRGSAGVHAVCAPHAVPQTRRVPGRKGLRRRGVSLVLLRRRRPPRTRTRRGGDSGGGTWRRR